MTLSRARARAAEARRDFMAAHDAAVARGFNLWCAGKRAYIVAFDGLDANTPRLVVNPALQCFHTVGRWPLVALDLPSPWRLMDVVVAVEKARNAQA